MPIVTVQDLPTKEITTDSVLLVDSRYKTTVNDVKNLLTTHFSLANHTHSNYSTTNHTHSTVTETQLKQIFPVGFVYVQFPGMKPPSQLLPFGTWSLIDYGGAFFRSYGAGSASFYNTLLNDNNLNLTTNYQAEQLPNVRGTLNVQGSLNNQGATGFFSVTARGDHGSGTSSTHNYINA